MAPGVVAEDVPVAQLAQQRRAKGSAVTWRPIMKKVAGHALARSSIVTNRGRVRPRPVVEADRDLFPPRGPAPDGAFAVADAAGDPVASLRRLGL
jgi:hypothetical protein